MISGCRLSSEETQGLFDTLLKTCEHNVRSTAEHHDAPQVRTGLGAYGA